MAGAGPHHPVRGAPDDRGPPVLAGSKVRPRVAMTHRHYSHAAVPPGAAGEALGEPAEWDAANFLNADTLWYSSRRRAWQVANRLLWRPRLCHLRSFATALDAASYLAERSGAIDERGWVAGGLTSPGENALYPFADLPLSGYDEPAMPRLVVDGVAEDGGAAIVAAYADRRPVGEFAKAACGRPTQLFPVTFDERAYTLAEGESPPSVTIEAGGTLYQSRTSTPTGLGTTDHEFTLAFYADDSAESFREGYDLLATRAHRLSWLWLVWVHPDDEEFLSVLPLETINQLLTGGAATLHAIAADDEAAFAAAAGPLLAGWLDGVLG